MNDKKSSTCWRDKVTTRGARKLIFVRTPIAKDVSDISIAKVAADPTVTTAIRVSATNCTAVIVATDTVGAAVLYTRFTSNCLTRFTNKPNCHLCARSRLEKHAFTVWKNTFLFVLAAETE
jgi:hypothetical protein